MGTERFIRTSHGLLAIEESGQGQLPVVLIHGNSSCREVFREQLELGLFKDCRLIAVDLPGHGRSEDAVDPDRTYTLPGLAEAINELLEILRVTKPVVMGWSLGGHLAIEMLSLSNNIRALVLCGTPPVGKLDGRNILTEGFNNPPSSLPAPDRPMDRDPAASFVDRIFRGTGNDSSVEAAMRTDGRFRRRLIESSLQGFGVNQKNTVEHTRLPIAIINGAGDQVIKPDFFQTLAIPNLWENKIHLIECAGHAPFWEKPEEFNLTLSRFLSFLVNP